MKINKLWFLKNVYKNKSRIDIFQYILLSTLIVLITPLMFLSLKYIFNGTHSLELIIVFLLFILTAFIIPAIIEIENKIIKKLSIEDFENKDNFSTSIYDRFINMKKFDYCLENKEKIEFLFENKEWIFKIYIDLDMDKKIEFLKNQEFIYYIKDIPENVKFDYLKNTIYEIENNNLVDYYSIISELFVNIDDKELNNIKYKNQILLEKKELCSNKIISL